MRPFEWLPAHRSIFGYVLSWKCSAPWAAIGDRGSRGNRMNEFVAQLIGKIASSLIPALLVTALGVRLAFSRYKKEKLWERKLDAYTKILDALHVSRLSSHQKFREAHTEVERSVEDEEARKKKQGDAWAEIQRAFDVSSLIISEEAASYLKEKLKPRYEAWEEDDPIDFWAEEEKIEREAIEHLKLLARRDLNG